MNCDKRQNSSLSNLAHIVKTNKHRTGIKLSLILLTQVTVPEQKNK